MECIVQKGIITDLYSKPLEELTLKDFDRIYINYASHKAGFMNDGKMFINSLMFDLKMDVNDFNFIPVKYETRRINIKTNQDECFRKNIGYHLYRDDIEYKHILRCYPNGEIYLYTYMEKEKKGYEKEVKII